MLPGQVRRKLQARAFRVGEILRIRQRRNGDVLAQVQALQRRIHQLVHLHRAFRRQGVHIPAGPFPDFGARDAGQNGLDDNAILGQFARQGMGQRQQERLGPAIDSGLTATAEAMFTMVPVFRALKARPAASASRVAAVTFSATSRSMVSTLV